MPKQPQWNLKESRWATKKDKRTGKAQRSSRTGKPIRFPVEPHGDKGNLPKDVKVVSANSPLKSKGTQLEYDTIAHRKILDKHPVLVQNLKSQGLKGWSVGFKFKDGTKQIVPAVAKDSAGALREAKGKLRRPYTDAKEVVIVDPTLSEVLHKMETSSGNLETVPIVASAIEPLIPAGSVIAHKNVTLSPEAAADLGVTGRSDVTPAQRVRVLQKQREARVAEEQLEKEGAAG